MELTVFVADQDVNFQMIADTLLRLRGLRVRRIGWRGAVRGLEGGR